MPFSKVAFLIARRCEMNDATSPLLTDLYQLNMIHAYLDHGGTKTAVFEFFVRKFPARRGLPVAAGCAYRLQEYAGLARRKLSTGKATWPGRKQVWRRYGPERRMAGDVLSIESDHQSGEPLTQLIMQGGRRSAPSLTLAESRAGAAGDLARLPEPLHRLESRGSYPVQVADALARLAIEVARHLVSHKMVPA